MIPIAVEYNDKHGGIYFPREGESVVGFLLRIKETETQQGRPIENMYGLKMVIGSASPAFIGGFNE